MLAIDTTPRSSLPPIRTARRLLRVVAGGAVVLAILSTDNSLCAQYGEDSKLTDDAFARERISALIAQLDHKEPSERIEAIGELARLGAEARPAASKLIDLLSDDASHTEFVTPVAVSREAYRALIAIGSEVVTALRGKIPRQSEETKQLSVFIVRRIGPDARELLPQFLREYETAGEDEQTNLLAAIAAIDPTGEKALPLLLKALRENESDSVRRTAARWLKRSTLLQPSYWEERAPAVQWFRNSSYDKAEVAGALRAALRDKSPDVRALAAISLSTYPESAEQSVAALIHLLADSGAYWVYYSNHVGVQVSVAHAAAHALTQFPAHVDQSVPRLIEAALDPDKPVPAARFALSRLIPHTKQPIEHVKRLLESDQPDLAFLPLARHGNSSRAMTLELQELTASDDKLIALEAAITLACLDVDANPDAVRVVQKALTVKNADADQSAVCQFVKAVGPNASFGAPLLRQHIIIVDDVFGPEIRKEILTALASIGADAVVSAPLVIEHLDKGMPFFAGDKEDALVAFGPKVVPLLIRALEHPVQSPQHRVSCLCVLGRFGSAARDAVPAIIVQLDSEYPRVRKATVEALGAIATQPTESLRALHRSLSDPRPFVRAMGSLSIAAFAANAEKSVPALVERLSDGYLDVRVAAAITLGRLGAAATDAIPALEALADVENVLLRDSARESLAAIRAK